MQEINKPLLFIGGDLNGIQNFIYNVSSKKAAVSLKGRSEWLSRYMENVCKNLIKLAAIDVGSTKDVVYCSGGKFYAITNDSAEIRQSLDSYIKRVKKDLWNSQNGQICISIAYTPFSFITESKIKIEQEEYSIGELWRQTNARFSKEKNRKFYDVITSGYDQLFKVQPVGGNVHVCAITGVENNDCIQLEDEEDSIWVLPSVKEQIQLGQKLRNQEHFKTFQEYAGDSFLGVLRMDVDGLGTRFIKGFTTIDEYKSFSEKLRLFFDKNLQAIQQQEIFCDYLNIIYAGGDDIFVVGRWDKVIDFASTIRNEFSSYIGDEKLSISGGMAIVGPKFPISKAAEIAGEAENTAKSFNQGQKNAFSFLGECVSWNKEFPKVKAMKADFINQIQDFGLSRGILHKLMAYASIAAEGKNMSYLWHSVYYLTRLLASCPDKCKPFIRNIRDNEINQGVRNFQLIALAARWAELEIRNN